MEFVIRVANIGDCKDIARMMAELHEDLELSHKIKIKHEDLEQDGFGTNPLFHGIIAEVPDHLRTKDGHTKIGYAIYFYSYSSMTGRAIYMENLYVMPEFRGNNINKALMSKVAKLGLAVGCSRLMFTVNRNQSLLEFYLSQDCSNITDDPGYLLMRCEGEALEKLART